MAALRTIADTGTVFTVAKLDERQARPAAAHRSSDGSLGYSGRMPGRANAMQQGTPSHRKTVAGCSLLSIRWWPGTICVALFAIAFCATVLTIMVRAEIKRMEPPVVTSSGKDDLLRRPNTPIEPYAVVVTRGDGVLVLRRLR